MEAERMATVVLPQVLVFQELELIPAVVENPLNAFITGGHAQLVRFGESTEQGLGELGSYDSAVEECFVWPNREAGAAIDPSYTKVWIKDALLKYFEDFISTGDTITKTATNKITSAATNFAENTATYPRDAAFFDRDVQPGDIADVRAVVGPDVFTLRTFVQDLEGEIIPSTVGAAFIDPNNAVTDDPGSVTVTKTAGPDNCVAVTGDNATGPYDPCPSGFVQETYTVIVLEGSVASDLTTAKLRVLSASGEDDVDEVVPEPAGTATAIGTRGLLATFDFSSGSMCSASASDEVIPPDDLVAGQTWELAVSGPFVDTFTDHGSMASGGTYTGDVDTTYIIEVTKGVCSTTVPSGGNLDIEFAVTTTDGSDAGITKLIAADFLPAPTLPIILPIGTKGVEFNVVAAPFTGLRKGDKYFIPVTAEAEGALRTIVLGNSLDEDVPDSTEVDLTLYIKKPNLSIPENREGFAPLVNWTQSATEICMQSAIEGEFDSSWSDGGVPLSIPVVEGVSFVEYRAWRSDLCTAVNAIHDVAQLNDAIPGALTPDNPLKWGVFKALENSNGTEVKYAAVCNPDVVEDWIEVLELIVGRDDVYGLVPLTRNQTVLDLFVAHANDQSNEINNLWRVVWVNLTGEPTKVLAYDGSSSDGEVIEATLEDDPDTSGTQYTIIKVPANNSDFLANDVKPGDIVRYLFTTDGFGNESFTEFVIDAVISENELRLATAHSVPIAIAQKLEVWRNLSSAEEAQEIALKAGSYGDRRVRATWPDTISSGDVEQAGYFLNAALAGLVSGVVPHQGLTRLEISGFTEVSRTVDKFNKDHLDTMAGGGVWIVTQDLRDGGIFTRHAITTGDGDDLLQREEVITRNVDSISFEVFRLFDPFIGISNVTPTMISLAEGLLEQLITVLENRNAIQRLGAQLIDGTIDRIEQSQLLKDRLLVELTLVIPAPLNNVEVHLIVTV
jgi:hypothetical protein